jgi:Site-specific recombinase XerD
LETKLTSRKREEHLSPDGKWRSFPRVPHLLQYVPSSVYYGRIKVRGKIIRDSLNTDVWTTAKLRLIDFLKKHKEARHSLDTPLFSEAAEALKSSLKTDTRLKPRSVQYRLDCITKMERTWPEVWKLRIGDIKAKDCQVWASKLQGRIAPQYFNNMVGTLRMIIAAGIAAHREETGDTIENVAMEVKRVRIRPKDLTLPEPDHFRLLVTNLRKKSGGWGPRVADLVEFLAYSGMRIRTEALWVNWEDVDWNRKEIIVRGDPVTATKNSEFRRIPIIKDMESLLGRLKAKLGTQTATGRILSVRRAHESLARACKELGIPRLTHHDFRHLFATRCIESGVDIPTVSRWLGHKDGGVLALKTYGHLRNEHSQAMAQKVRF